MAKPDAVRRFYAAINGGEIDAALSLLREDVRWRRPPDVPITGTIEGRDGVGRMWRAFAGSLERFEIEPTGFEAGEDPNRVLARVTMRGSRGGDDPGFEFSGVQVFTLDDGEIAEVAEFRSLDEGRAALTA